MTHKNNLPLFAEEQKQLINEEQLSLQKILNQFQQLVPVDFIQLETKGKNYMCSTMGWKEPVCERYIFFDRDKSIQLDIPQELIVELGLKKGQDIPYSLYVLPATLNKELSLGAIEIKDKKEIFIQKPLNINNLEQELTNWLTELRNSRKKISQLVITEKLSQNLNQENQFLKTELKGEKQLVQSEKEITQAKINALKGEKEHISNALWVAQQELNQKDEEITRLRNKIREVETERNNRPTQQQLENLRKELERKNQELQKELSWWDKWFNERLTANGAADHVPDSCLNTYISNKLGMQGRIYGYDITIGFYEDMYTPGHVCYNTGKNYGPKEIKRIKKLIKVVHDYYVSQ